MFLKNRFEVELKVGVFVTLGVFLLMTAIILLGGIENLVTKHHRYTTYYNQVEGLIPGSKIILNGIRVGVVDQVAFDTKRREIRVEMLISEDYAEWIRVDTTAEIQTQGMLGDKYIGLTTATFDAPPLPPGSEIRNKTTGNLSQFITSGETLMGTLNQIASSLERVLKSFERKGRNEVFFQGVADAAQNLSKVSKEISGQVEEIKIKSSVDHLNSILSKVDSGTGTIGALINDPSLYDELRLLFGGANRNRVLRNIVRQTVKDAKEKE